MRTTHAVGYCFLVFLLTFTLGSVCLYSFSGCGPTPPIVANPVEPWEQEATRGMMRPQTPTPHPRVERQDLGKGDELPEEEHSPWVTAVADIIGFPFRGVAWLAHVLL